VIRAARSLVVLVPLLLAGACGSSDDAQVRAVPLPPGFVDELVARVSQPTAVAFTPDGRMLIATKPGVLRVIDRRGRLKKKPALDVSSDTCAEVERGMAGVTVDPAFASNSFVYVYYTRERNGRCPVRRARGPVNRLVRYVLGRTSVADRSSEMVLLDNILSYAAIHNGGGLRFGPDGLLYVGVGDGGRDYLGRGYRPGDNPVARDLNVLLGKIVRITRDGDVPEGNPFRGPGTVPCARARPVAADVRCQEIYAWGLRNPFRLAFDPNQREVRFFINDVGSHTWEEISDGRVGADYGWNLREGFCPQNIRVRCSPAPPGMTDPVFAYGHETGCRSITGGAFVPEEASWPSAYRRTYLFADFTCGRIFVLRRRDDGFQASAFHVGLDGAGVTDLSFDPRGDALYYTEFLSGEVRRIRFAPH
jgi:glucose/arabinose dehydrogenase